MFSRAALAGASGAVLLATLSGSARAELVESASTNVSGGATDNAAMAPAGSSNVKSDAFTSVRAGLQAGYVGRQSDQTLAYSYSGTFYATQNEGNLQNHGLGWRFHTTPTGTTDLRATADASYSHLSAATPLAATGTVNPQMVMPPAAVASPAGTSSYYGLGAAAYGSYQPGGRYVWSEFTTISRVYPTSNELPKSLIVYQGVHSERIWGRNALTTDLLLSYLDADAFQASPTAAVTPGGQSGGFQLLVGWKHDYSASLVGNFGAGALFTDSLKGGNATVQPAINGKLQYQRGLAMAQLSVSQSLQANQYSGGQMFVADVAAGGAFLALDRLERFHFVASGSAQHSSLVTGGSLASAAELLIGDVGFSYRPLRYPFLASVDYNIYDQIGHSIGGAASYPDIHRQMVMLTVTGIWQSDSSAH